MTDTPPMFLNDAQYDLLKVAEGVIQVVDCENYCVHHRKGRACCDCPSFAIDGYVSCEGYEQEGDGDA